ncbi:hypothetical protein INT47_008357 [Mucor saturninus]|uniref:Uncharacterized protein n=1 Tax=Mucor saturninus TaxID=64648 RepID=A0A8H7VAM6_9FUNG|nr:hypothetical protein INT47_008357 [Mucor saturninus]
MLPNNGSSEHINNEDGNSTSNWVEKLSLSDISVGEILDIYKNDTDLLKHILAAKTEEDKRKGAEEMRRAEEARLHSKFIDLQLDQNRRSSMLDGLSQNDWLSPVHNDLLSPFLNNTPPSPSSQLQPLSPYTLFEVPFADLNLSAPSSPEPVLVEKIINKEEEEPQKSLLPPIPPNMTKERNSCKRTLSRTRSTRKPSIKALSKKNRSQPKEEESTVQQQQVKEELPLDHDKVMEALRAKLQRSTQQQKEQKNVREEITSMSPSGILLLDLKNPKKSFPVRQKATPRASVVRKPNSFISAHKPPADFKA